MTTKPAKKPGLARGTKVTSPPPRKSGAASAKAVVKEAGPQLADAPKPIPEPAPAPATETPPAKSEMFQMNLRITKNMGRIIAALTEKHGSQRVAIALALKALGEPITDDDLRVSNFGPKRRTWQ